METREFTKLYNKLNPSQRKAVDAVEGSVMVVAGPGTGKTQVLTLRIANILLKTQINPENILALTFTEAAAYEMRKRLLTIIGQDAYRVEITTFHSFCNNFIKRHQEEFANIIASESINEIDQLQIIEEVMEDTKLKNLRPLGDVSYYIKPVLSQINELKRENVTPATFEKSLKDFEKELNEKDDLYHSKGAYKGKMKAVHQKAFRDMEKNYELLIVYKAYQEKLAELKKYDYNDMLLEVSSKLQKNPYLLQFIQEKYQYFLVDEHQDTNASQNKIIELMASFYKNPNLFVVGDEKQAIFRFQGASLENFLYFKTIYPEAILINLNHNYRSTKTILDATHSLISNNPESTRVISDGKPLIKNALHNEEKIGIVKVSNNTLEYYWVAEKIKKIISKNKKFSAVILARNNRDLFPFVTIFDSEKIPYVIESENNILDDMDVQKVILLLRAVNHPDRSDLISKALFLDCFNIDPFDIFRIIRKRHDEKKSMWEILQDKRILKELDLKNEREIERFVKMFLDTENGFVKLSNNDRFDKLFVAVLNKSGLLVKILGKENAQEILSRLSRLYEEIREELMRNPKFSLSDFLKYIELLEKHQLSLAYNAHVIPENVARLMTVHKSKGLEFDYVFLINAHDTHWGNKKRRGASFNIPWEQLSLRLNRNIEDNENVDERRLFYVAMTRAKKKVYISYSLSSDDGREQIPSQFILEIPESLIEYEDTKDFESEFTLNREKIFKIFEQTEKTNEQQFSKQYIKELFLRQGLSATALNNYLKCPWKFFFANLIRIPETIDDPGLFGNTIHAAINRFIIEKKKGKKVSEDFLLNLFQEEFDKQPISEGEKERFHERGVKAMKSFYKNRLENISTDANSELEIRGIRINDLLIINGKIDLAEPNGNDGFTITDFKTGKVRSRNRIEGNIKGGDGDYKRQLVFYKILLDKYRNGFFKMKKGVIEFVEPTEKGDFRKEEFEITKEEQKELLDQIIKIGEEIVNLSFWNKNCEDEKCEYCSLRNYMLGKIAN